MIFPLSSTKLVNASVAAIAIAGAVLTLATQQARGQSVSATTLSQTSKSGGEVKIEADQMQVLEKQQKAIFSGRVNARRAQVRLNSDKLIVTYQKAKKSDGKSKTEVTFLDAQGHVRIITTKQRITGNRAKMNVKANNMVITGNVIVYQGKTVVKGSRLFIDFATNTSKMTGDGSGGRVQSVFGTGQ